MNNSQMTSRVVILRLFADLTQQLLTEDIANRSSGFTAGTTMLRMGQVLRAASVIDPSIGTPNLDWCDLHGAAFDPEFQGGERWAGFDGEDDISAVCRIVSFAIQQGVLSGTITL